MTGTLDWENIILGFRLTTKDFLETVLGSLSESIIVTDLDGKIVYYNEGSEGLFGYRPEEILVRSIIELGVRKPNVLAEMRKGRTFRGEVLLRRKSGERFPAHIICIPLRDRSGAPMAMVGAARDLTEEKEVNRLREFNENIITSLNDGIQIIDKDGIITFANKRFEEMVGRGGGELIGRHYQRFMDRNVLESVGGSMETLHKGADKKTFEATYITKDKREVPVLISSSRLYRNGNYDGMINAVTDLTEIRVLKEELYQSEKLTLLGTLAGEIAHEVNNPLSGLILAVQMLIDDAKEGHIERKELLIELKDIENDAMRCKRFIEKILGFSKMVPEAKGLVNINDTVEEALALIQRQAKLDNVSVVKAFSSRPLYVLGNANQLQQVIINVVNNSRDALFPEGGTVTIKTSAVAAKGKRWVCLEIGDTGHGIPEGITGRIFDSFFTTKAKGTGLGLSVGKKIIEDHGGTITAQNLQNHGASFVVTLPRKRWKMSK
ncbi:MAG: PAS domain S-box protein [Syntrophobacteraceae bacterium]|nr:PAS domain S-box protein [Syntrophobacteraceae bacterium]